MDHYVQLDLGPTQKFVIAVVPLEQAETFSLTRAGRSTVQLGQKAIALVTTDQSDPGAKHSDYQHARGLEETCKRHGAQRVATLNL